jgi:hypothetical protein
VVLTLFNVIGWTDGRGMLWAAGGSVVRIAAATTQRACNE